MKKAILSSLSLDTLFIPQLTNIILANSWWVIPQVLNQ